MATYKATARNGKEIIRKSTSRIYTHAVVGTWNENPEDPRYGYLGFCGSKALAEKVLAKYTQAWLLEKNPGCFWEIVEVEVIG